jgi:predicted GIY-YIG superfamily endonuclease
MADDPWHVYVLRNKRTGSVYTGCTNRPAHRLRAHCCFITGGARTTRRWVSKHGPDVVSMFMLVGPLDKKAAQSLERKMKQTRVGPPGTPGRLQAIIRLLRAANENDGYVTDKCHLHKGSVQVQLSCSKQDGLTMATPKSKSKIETPLATLPSDLVVWRFDCQLPPA